MPGVAGAGPRPGRCGMLVPVPMDGGGTGRCRAAGPGDDPAPPGVNGTRGTCRCRCRSRSRPLSVNGTRGSYRCRFRSRCRSCPARVNGTRGSCRARRGADWPEVGGGRAVPSPAEPPRPPPPPPPARSRRPGGAMRPAPLLGLLLWAPLLWAPQPVRGLRHGVHWNGSNPRFLQDDYSIEVAINDYLDIYCPHYEGAVPAGRAETFTLFMVDREGYRGCYETPGAFKRWECNRPWAPFGPVRFSEKIQRFTPFSLGFEFQPGETYYYISVPTPESTGRCLKLRVSVCCRGTTPEPVTEVPNSQPHGRGGPEDAVPARGITAPLQPCAPCLVLVLLTLLWI